MIDRYEALKTHVARLADNPDRDAGVTLEDLAAECGGYPSDYRHLLMMLAGEPGYTMTAYVPPSEAWVDELIIFRVRGDLIEQARG